MKKKLRTVKIENAAGKVLMHDITRIVPGKFKGPAFKKGHVIRPEDIGKLKDLGKENIYVFDVPDDEFHENQAGGLFKGLAGKNIDTSGPTEGKVVFISKVDGLVKVKGRIVEKINSIGDIAFTTVHSHVPVKAKERIAGIRAIPLTIKRKAVNRALSYCSSPPLEVSAFKKKRIGLIVTGTEVACGRIKDRFRPVIEKKVKAFKCRVNMFKILGDEPDNLQKEILNMANGGCDFIILTGGMSVDPDDTTKTAIKEAGVSPVFYGAPLLPGNMFMAGYLEHIPVFGVPACALFYEITVLDIFLPYVFSGTIIEKKDILKRGYGGYCRHCEICNFPRCGFGKS